eukprot:TRINITY_DN9922_c0_g1_i1.p1 TRINITY_DN9922_c0_g1~~TRINITY_DN9922_c0_g1_i1.p1  ORF type:complete len:334 (-),score=73.79 TRINITY_DN9922_c0_g1_i1:130-1131(-)
MERSSQLGFGVAMAAATAVAAARGSAFCVGGVTPLRAQLRLARATAHLRPTRVSQPAAAGYGSVVAGSAAVVTAAVGRKRTARSLSSCAAAAAVEKTPLQTRVEEIIALQPVVMISKTTCPFCAQAKSAFDSLGARVSVIELDKLDPPVMAEIQEHMGTLTGATTVPRVFIGRKFIGGGTDTMNLHDSGELKTLVDAAVAKSRSELQGEYEASVTKSNEEWTSELSQAAFRVLRQRGTEPPNSHEYNTFLPEKGYFGCAGCGLPLYSASSKYASSCGWPVFNKCYFSDDVGCHVGTRTDGSGSLEIFCPRCNSHLGHVFFDAFSETNKNGERH